MAKKLVSKTFKVEMEVTVEMEELEVGNVNERDTPHLVNLQNLQKALLKDDASLNKQMLAVVSAKLQEYIDYLSLQDNQASLAQVIDRLDQDDKEYFTDNACDLAGITRPLRLTSMSVKMERACIEEKASAREDQPEWRPVWRDLFFETALGEQLAAYYLPGMPARPRAETAQDHYLLASHLTRQVDGVHFEARCSCDVFLEAVGSTPELALLDLWERYQKHYRSAMGKRLNLVDWWKRFKTGPAGHTG